jgi:hypothetical protein
MGFIDWIQNRNEVPKAIESLPDHVKSAAIEAARPVVETAGSGAVPKNAPVQPQATPNPRRGLVLGR